MEAYVKIVFKETFQSGCLYFLPQGDAVSLASLKASHFYVKVHSHFDVEDYFCRFIHQILITNPPEQS